MKSALWILCVVMSLASACGGPARPAASAPPVELGASAEPLSDEQLTRAVVSAAGEGMAGLNDKGETMALELAKELGCPCAGSEVSLAACLASDGACPRASFAARAILRALGRGEKPKKVAPRLLERFGPVEPEAIDLSRAPCRGEAAAPATLVVYSDFQCPFCALGKRLVMELERRAGKRLRVCFKNWPLTKIHPKAMGAAKASVAAQRQGKFWEMHDLMFDNRENLEREDLLAHAKDLGLDLKQFEADMDAPKTEAGISLDIKEAKGMGLRGTPAFIVNGRRYTDPKTPDDFMDWVEEAAAESKKQKAKSKK